MSDPIRIHSEPIALRRNVVRLVDPSGSTRAEENLEQRYARVWIAGAQAAATGATLQQNPYACRTQGITIGKYGYYRAWKRGFEAMAKELG